MKRHRQARFVVIEGPDGAGTTTQAEILAEALRARDLRVQRTAEPSEGPVGLVARAHVRKRIDLDPLTAALAFSADRADHLARTIRPALAEGTWVVCDRYLLSTLAYQGAEGVDQRWIFEVSSRFEVPDLTVFLDLPEAERARRVTARGAPERYESEELATRILASYRNALKLLQEAGQRTAVVSAGGTPAEVHLAILAEVDALD